MSKHKKVKAWGWVRDGELVMESAGWPWVFHTRSAARKFKRAGESVVRVEIATRILPNRKAR